MVTVKKCCCCISARTGAKAIAIFHLFWEVLILAIIIAIFACTPFVAQWLVNLQESDNADGGGSNEHIRLQQFLFLWLAFSTIIFYSNYCLIAYIICALIMDSLMFHGVKKFKHNFLLVWLIFYGICLGLTTIGSLIFVILMLAYITIEGGFITLTILGAVHAIWYYFWIVVYSVFKNMKEIMANETNPEQMTNAFPMTVIAIPDNPEKRKFRRRNSDK